MYEAGKNGRNKSPYVSRHNK